MEHLSAIISCWGGCAVSPAAELEQPTEEGKCTNTTTHWKPMLQTISEEHPAPDVHSRRVPETRVKKKPVKARAPPPPYCHGKDNWKCCTRIIVPALSPTSFLF